MLFRKNFLEGIRTGAITVAFRRWKRPSVRAAGTLLTPMGQLTIRSVTPMEVNQITESDAHRAGYESMDALLAELAQREGGDVYCIELGPLIPDPRIALRDTHSIDPSDYQFLRDHLRRLDVRTKSGAWTLRTLQLIKAHPGVRARDLCDHVGQDKEQFKLNVRKLKNLGLTESLGTGYQLSPRGKTLLTLLTSGQTQ